MCGIAGVARLTDRPFTRMDEMVSMLYDGIEHRGRDATGYVFTKDDGTVRHQKGPLSASEFDKKRKIVPEDARYVLLHTRYATQGDRMFNENNHPVIYGDTLITHNGVLWNDDDLFQSHALVRFADVDTEAAAAVIDKFGFTRIGSALEELIGSFAIAAVNVKHPTDLVVARGNDSPLYMLTTKHLMVWASTAAAIKKAWARCVGTPPDDKRIVEVEEGTLFKVSAGGTIQSEEFFPQQAGYSKYYYQSRSNYSWNEEGYWDPTDDTEYAEYTNRRSKLIVLPPKGCDDDEMECKINDESLREAVKRASIGDWDSCEICDDPWHQSALTYHEGVMMCPDCCTQFGYNRGVYY